jgi:hypothetical protein
VKLLPWAATLLVPYCRGSLYPKCKQLFGEFSAVGRTNVRRYSVILVDYIDQDIHAGNSPCWSIIDATVRRFRPTVLTELAAVLTILFLSALHAGRFKVPVVKESWIPVF